MVFSDESTIAVLDDRVEAGSRKQGKEFEPQCLKNTIKFSQKIMVWCAISIRDTSLLFVVDGTMNTEKCISVLEKRLLLQIKV